MNTAIQAVIAAVGAVGMLAYGQRKAEEPGWIHFQGEYRNRAGYAYHVVVPPGLTGHKPPAPAPAHSFAIDLDPAVNASIWVDGSYNASYAISALSANQQHLKRLTEEHKIVGKPVFQQSKLASLAASQMLVHYRHGINGEERVREEIIAIRKSDPQDTMGIIYTIGLDTTVGRYSMDHVTLIGLASVLVL